MPDTEQQLSRSEPAYHQPPGEQLHPRAQPLMPRVMRRVKVDENGCWVYQRGKQRKGYGIISWNGTNWLVHRAVYVSTFGPLPEDRPQLDHLCLNKACCNPMHLEPVTLMENVRRADNVAWRNAKKTHCPKGHEYTPENTTMQPRPYSPKYKRGGFARVCATCYPDRARRFGTVAQNEENAA